MIVLKIMLKTCNSYQKNAEQYTLQKFKFEVVVLVVLEFVLKCSTTRQVLVYFIQTDKNESKKWQLQLLSDKAAVFHLKLQIQCDFNARFPNRWLGRN
jgi:hypothetical protein